MQKHLHEKNLDTLDLVEKRLEIIVGAKLIDKTKTEEAVLNNWLIFHFLFSF